MSRAKKPRRKEKKTHGKKEEEEEGEEEEEAKEVRLNEVNPLLRRIGAMARPAPADRHSRSNLSSNSNSPD